VLIGFDINWSDNLTNHIDAEGVICKAHKLIFKLTENIRNLVED